MMKPFEQQGNCLFLPQKSFSKKKEGYQFFNELCRGAIQSLKRFYDLQPENLKEHGFEYREQQIKTFLTLALGKMTKGNLMQEFPMERVKRRTKRGETLGNGFVDYWAATEEVTCFIEVKRHWVRFFPDEQKFTFFQKAANRLQSARTQVNQIKDKSYYFNTPHAYGLSLLITPVYAYAKEPDIVRLDEKLRNQLIVGAKKFKAEAAVFWRISRKRLHSYPLEDSPDVEYYPGVVFWGRLRKISRG